MGEDKAQLNIGGEMLIERQLRVLTSLAPAQILLAGPALDAVRHPNVHHVADAAPDSGPLAGLVAGLRSCRTPLLLALAVDLPCMTADFLATLLDACAPDRGIIPANDRFEPLAAIYPNAALALAEDQLRRGQLSLQHLASRCLADDLVARHPITAAEAPLFFNLNTPADLARMP